jgi:hypothetical protein
VNPQSRGFALDDVSPFVRPEIFFDRLLSRFQGNLHKDHNL